MGDALVINIWQNGKNIYTVGGLIEARDMSVYYDKADDIAYMVYLSEREERIGAEVESTTFVSVTTIENPGGDAVCNTFNRLIDM